MPYNGHKNYAHWNVALWIGNDEGLYNLAREAVRRPKTLDQAAEALLQTLHDIGLHKTPDGAVYNKTNIRAAIRDL